MTSLTNWLTSIDWPSWLLLPAASAVSRHLLADHPVSLYIVDQHWWKLYPTCYFSNSDSQLSYIYTAYTSLACVAFATILHFQTLATCQATSCWCLCHELCCSCCRHICEAENGPRRQRHWRNRCRTPPCWWPCSVLRTSQCLVMKVLGLALDIHVRMDRNCCSWRLEQLYLNILGMILYSKHHSRHVETRFHDTTLEQRDQKRTRADPHLYVPLFHHHTLQGYSAFCKRCFACLATSIAPITFLHV